MATCIQTAFEYPAATLPPSGRGNGFNFTAAAGLVNELLERPFDKLVRLPAPHQAVDQKSIECA